MIAAHHAVPGDLYRTPGQEAHSYIVIPSLTISALRARLVRRRDRGLIDSRDAWLLARLTTRTRGGRLVAFRKLVLLEIRERVRIRRKLVERRRYIVVDPCYRLRQVKRTPSAMRLSG